jgi:hypothetical protein
VARNTAGTLAAALLLLPVAVPPAAAQRAGLVEETTAPLTFGSLLGELADRDRLAIFPGDTYTQHQVSSHDPRNAAGFSKRGSPWGFANVDFGNYVRQQTIDGRKEWVLLEEPGPGAITRWWSVGIDDELLASGVFRVYLDGASTPAIEASAVDLVGGDNSGFGSALNFGTPERGGNLYAPIPYRSAIKITWDGPTTHGGKDVASRDPKLKHSTESALWYNINYRRFGAGTDVTSFTRSDAADWGEALGRVNRHLSRPALGQRATETLSAKERLDDGSVVAHRIAGPAVIRRVKVRVSGEDPVAALRDTTLVLTFDGRETARVPVAEFFGNGESASREDPYNEGGDSARQVVATGEMTSYWVMPFRESAEVQLVNESGQPVNVALAVDVGKWSWDERSMHFHADHRWERGIPTRSAGDAPWPGVAGKRELYSAEGDADFRFIDIRGAGVYVGDTLSIRNRSTGPGLNAWWGEGDEKIYIDYLDKEGDGSTATPDHKGTGTEDYYGYSFGSGKEFTSPFVTQPNAAGNRTDDGALTVNGRVRGLDGIPFHHSFKFDMELWKWREGEIDIGAATFWYGIPGAASMSVAADLAIDYSSASDRRTVADVGLTDTAGDGRWLFLSSDNADPGASAARVSNLAWGNVGDRGARGFLGAEGGGRIPPALSDGREPGYHELEVHPGSGDAACPYVIARWVAGDASSGLINISGSVRNLVEVGDGVSFVVYVDGERAFEGGADAGRRSLGETYFDFDRTVEAGQFVDLVVGNGGHGDAEGDESAVRFVIRSLN